MLWLTLGRTRLATALIAVAAVACRTNSVAERPNSRSAADTEWGKRDAWQRPAEVMDALGIRAGSVVADVGAGGGYFTFHLASRVGPHGKVYAEDILDSQVEKIRERAKREGLPQVETILGSQSDPKLPPGALDAILLVLTYHEMENYDAMLDGIAGALKPAGLLAVIDPQGDPNQSRSSYAKEHKMSKELVLEDAARHNLRFVREADGFVSADDNSHLFFLIFEKPAPGRASRDGGE
jgi:predicted methyltransferase